MLLQVSFTTYEKRQGAYEPVKEHETEFNDSPNYVIVWRADGTLAVSCSFTTFGSS